MPTERDVKLGAELATVLVFEKDGAAVEKPEEGEYTISMKKGMRFAGYHASAIEKLQAAFQGCSFSWKPEPPPPPRNVKGHP